MTDSADAPQPLVRQATICNQRGLHARAAAKFVRTAERFSARVEVSRDDMTVVGTSILGLMLLAAGAGTVLTLRADGEDAEAALAALCDLIERGFDE
ncbi:HPr family phosphocarrier protein [Benzoatithermus flavus]|uniref:HPr family phosphocarrier protein n=1 Tax=Benzoatithermus flavus TaxID=3108223 RepID=A0ABU8XPX2_9PROT